MGKHLKGQEVTLKIGDAVVAKSTSCTLNMTANTTDSSSKDDDNAYFADSEVTYVTWDASNESFVTTVSNLKSLMTSWLNRTKITVSVDSTEGDKVAASGSAYITSLGVTANNGDYATISLSFTGDGPLS